LINYKKHEISSIKEVTFLFFLASLVENCVTIFVLDEKWKVLFKVLSANYGCSFVT